MEQDSPTVLRRRIGAELRRLREDAGLQAQEVAQSLSFSAAKVSRMESGSVTLKERDVRALLALYGVTDATEVQQFIGLMRQSTQRGWWHDYSDALPDWLRAYVGLEADASRIRTFETEAVPGLFQIEDYARAALRAGFPSESAEEIKRRVHLRLQRQEILTRPKPPEVWAILNEAVVRRPCGGSKAMAEQLRHLVAVADKPNVTIQVLPFSAGAHASLGLAFSILSFNDLPGSVGYSEAPTSAIYIERNSDIRAYEATFERLMACAMQPEQSLIWLEEQAREYDNA